MNCAEVVTQTESITVSSDEEEVGHCCHRSNSSSFSLIPSDCKPPVMRRPLILETRSMAVFRRRRRCRLLWLFLSSKTRRVIGPLGRDKSPASWKRQLKTRRVLHDWAGPSQTPHLRGLFIEESAIKRRVRPPCLLRNKRHCKAKRGLFFWGVRDLTWPDHKTNCGRQSV